VRYTDLVNETKLSKSTAHRILSILTNEGLVHYDEHTKTYRLGTRVMEWALRVWRDFDLREDAVEEMNKLNRETGENINLAIRDKLEIIYINRVESFKPVRAVATLGSRASLHYTALGKAMVAFLPEETQKEIARGMTYEKMSKNTITNAREFLDALKETRKRGYAIDDCEFRDEIRCIAAPVFNFQGEPVGAISITSLVYRVPKKKLVSWVPNLLTAARVTSQKIGYVDDGK
jgi:DNA-binding IclR family transcriptional regulator